MNKIFDILASTTRFIRLQRNIDQKTVANEAGISLRTIQNIEAGKPVNSSSLLAYLSYLDLLDNMIATLPDPDKLTPIELLQAAPVRRARARKGASDIAENSPVYTNKDFKWGDEE